MVNFHARSWKSENVQFDGLLLSKTNEVLDEKVQKTYVSWHWRVMQSWRKTDSWFQKQTWRIWWVLMQAVASVLLLSIACKVSAKKVQKSYLLWHWRVIQTLKKNWLFAWKMAWGIWWILSGKSENLHFDGLLL